MSELNEHGQEVFDQTPVEFPIHFDRPTPLHIRLRQQILDVFNVMRHQDEFETPEEADDFNVPDDPEIWDSPYEGDFDHMQDEKFSEVSKEESGESGSSDGTSQGEQGEPSSKEK